MATAKRNHAIAYWLIPSQPAKKCFQQQIRELAERFHAPAFEPHLTIFVAPESSGRPSGILREIVKPNITLTITGLRHSDIFTRTLFVQFQKSGALQELSDELWRHHRGAERFLINPHLSLIYQHLHEETRRKLAVSTPLPFAEVRFERLVVMHCVSPTESADDVRAWRMMADQNSRIR